MVGSDCAVGNVLISNSCQLPSDGNAVAQAGFREHAPNLSHADSVNIHQDFLGPHSLTCPSPTPPVYTD